MKKALVKENIRRKLVIANKKLFFGNKEKAKRAGELFIAKGEKAKRVEELVIAKKLKAKRAAELVIANKKLLFENKEKAKRVEELVIANKKKAKRAAELVIANKKLLFENKEKEKATIYLKELEDKIKYYKKVVINSSEAVIIQDFNGTVRAWNKAATGIYGFNEAEMLGKKITNIISKKEWKEARKNIRAIQQGEPTFRIRQKRKTKDGKDVFVNITYSPIYETGEIIEVATTGEDVTLKKRTEEELLEEKRRLEEAEDVASLGSYSLNIKLGLWESSKEADKIFGINNKYIHSVDGWVNLVHPEDKKIMKSYLLNEVFGRHQPFNKEYRIIRQNDKSVRWVNGLGRLEFDKKSKPIKMIGTIQDITKRVEEAKVLDQAKNDFLILSSHQLRTPLSVTKWILETLKNNDNLTIKQQDKINNLDVSNERLIHLVNRFLSVAQIESGKIKVNKKVFNFKELMVDLVTAFKDLAQINHKEIKVGLPEGLLKVYCDPILVREVLENLINNAIYYSKEGSSDIKINVNNSSGEYLISVHNEGLIEKSILGQVLTQNKFLRGRTAFEKKPVGSGLGLYITKKLIEAVGGVLWFESNIKSGTTFYVKIINEKGKV